MSPLLVFWDREKSLHIIRALAVTVIQVSATGAPIERVLVLVITLTLIFAP